MRVTCKHCGSERIAHSTLVPRLHDVATWTTNDAGEPIPEDYDDAGDDACWEAETDDPDGSYWCRDCDMQLQDADLVVTAEGPAHA